MSQQDIKPINEQAIDLGLPGSSRVQVANTPIGQRGGLTEKDLEEAAQDRGVSVDQLKATLSEAGVPVQPVTELEAPVQPPEQPVASSEVTIPVKEEVEDLGLTPQEAESVGEGTTTVARTPEGAINLTEVNQASMVPTFLPFPSDDNRDAAIAKTFGQIPYEEMFMDHPKNRGKTELELADELFDIFYATGNPENDIPMKEKMFYHATGMLFERNMVERHYHGAGSVRLNQSLDDTRPRLKGMVVKVKDPHNAGQMIPVINFNHAIKNGGVAFWDAVQETPTSDYEIKLVKDMTPLQKMRMRILNDGIADVVPDVSQKGVIKDRVYTGRGRETGLERHGITPDDLVTTGVYSGYNLQNSSNQLAGVSFYENPNSLSGYSVAVDEHLGVMKTLGNVGISLTNTVAETFGFNPDLPEFQPDLRVTQDPQAVDLMNDLIDYDIGVNNLNRFMRRLDDGLKSDLTFYSVTDSFRFAFNFASRTQIFPLRIPEGEKTVRPIMPGGVQAQGPLTEEDLEKQKIIHLNTNKGTRNYYNIGDLVAGTAIFLTMAKNYPFQVFGKEVEQPDDFMFYDGQFFDMSSEKMAEILDVPKEEIEDKILTHPALSTFFTRAKEEVALAGGIVVSLLLMRRQYGKKIVNDAIDRLMKSGRSKNREEAILTLDKNRGLFNTLRDDILEEANKGRSIINAIPFRRRIADSLSKGNTDLYLSTTGPVRRARLEQHAKVAEKRITDIDTQIQNAANTAQLRALQIQRAEIQLRNAKDRAVAFIGPELVKELGVESGVIIGAAAVPEYVAETLFSDTGQNPIWIVGGGIMGALSAPKVFSTAGDLAYHAINIPSAVLGEVLIYGGSFAKDSFAATRLKAGTENPEELLTEIRDFYDKITSNFTPEELKNLEEYAANLIDLETRLREQGILAPLDPNNPDPVGASEVPVLLGDLLKSMWLQNAGNQLAVRGISETDVIKYNKSLNAEGTLVQQRRQLLVNIAQRLEKFQAVDIRRLEGEDSVIMQELSTLATQLERDLQESEASFKAAKDTISKALKNYLEDGENLFTDSDNPNSVRQMLFDIDESFEEDMLRLSLEGDSQSILQLGDDLAEIHEARRLGLEAHFNRAEEGLRPVGTESSERFFVGELQHRYANGRRELSDFYSGITENFGDISADYTEELTSLLQPGAEGRLLFPELYIDDATNNAIRLGTKFPKGREMAAVINGSATRFWDRVFTPNDDFKNPSMLIKNTMSGLGLYERLNIPEYTGKTNTEAFMWTRNFFENVSDNDLRALAEEEPSIIPFLQNLGFTQTTKQTLENSVTLNLRPLDINILHQNLNKARGKDPTQNFMLGQIKEQLLDPRKVFYRNQGLPNQEVVETGADGMNFNAAYRKGLDELVIPFYDTFSDPRILEAASGNPNTYDSLGIFTDFLKDLHSKRYVGATAADVQDHVMNSVVKPFTDIFGEYDPVTKKKYIVAGSENARLLTALLTDHFASIHLDENFGVIKDAGLGIVPAKINIKNTNLGPMEVLSRVNYYVKQEVTDADGKTKIVYVSDPSSPLIDKEAITRPADLKYTNKKLLRKGENKLALALQKAEKEYAARVFDKQLLSKNMLSLHRNISGYNKGMSTYNLYDLMKNDFKVLNLVNRAREQMSIGPLRNVPTDDTKVFEVVTTEVFDEEIASVLAAGVSKEITKRHTSGILKGQLYLDDGLVKQMLTDPEYEPLREALEIYNPEFIESLRAIDELTDIIRVPDPEEAGGQVVKNVRSINLLRGLTLLRATFARQISPTHMGAEILLTNSKYADFNSTAQILSSPEATRKLLKYILNNEDLTRKEVDRLSNFILVIGTKELVRGGGDTYYGADGTYKGEGFHLEREPENIPYTMPNSMQPDNLAEHRAWMKRNNIQNPQGATQ